MRDVKRTESAQRELESVLRSANVDQTSAKTRWVDAGIAARNSNSLAERSKLVNIGLTEVVRASTAATNVGLLLGTSSKLQTLMECEVMVL